MPYRPCIDSQAEAIVGKVLLIVEIELNSRDETCEAGKFEQTGPEADGKKILACHPPTYCLRLLILRYLNGQTLKRKYSKITFKSHLFLFQTKQQC